MTSATDTCKYSWIRDFKIGVLFRLPRTANVKFSFNVALSAQFKTCRSQLNVRSAVLWQVIYEKVLLILQDSKFT